MCIKIRNLIKNPELTFYQSDTPSYKHISGYPRFQYHHKNEILKEISIKPIYKLQMFEWNILWMKTVTNWCWISQQFKKSKQQMSRELSSKNNLESILVTRFSHTDRLIPCSFMPLTPRLSNQDLVLIKLLIFQKLQIVKASLSNNIIIWYIWQVQGYIATSRY